MMHQKIIEFCHTMDQIFVGIAFVICSCGQLMINIFQFGFHGIDLFKGLHGFVPNRSPFHKIKILLQETYSDISFRNYITFEKTDFTRKQLEQSRFSCSIFSD